MNRAVSRILIAVCFVFGLSTACIFSVETELEEADVGTRAGEDVDGNLEPSPWADAHVEIVEGPQQVTVDLGETVDLEYEFQCAPQGCEEHLLCRIGHVESGNWSDWNPCGESYVHSLSAENEGLHIFEVVVDIDTSDMGIVAEDHREILVLYRLDFAVPALDGVEEPIFFSYPRDYGIECSHPNCQIECHWTDLEDEEIEAGGCEDTTMIADPPGERREARLVLRACAEPAPADFEYCTETKSFEFHYADPRWTDISTGERHSCGILDDHSLWCWGANDEDQLGSPSLEVENAPRQIPGAWRRVDAGSEHTCAIDMDHTLHCWGKNDWGQVSPTDESTTISVPTALSDRSFDDLTAAVTHGCGVEKNTGALYCWGANLARSGEGSFDLEGLREIALPEGTERWLQVSAAWLHTCAIAEASNGDTRAYCFGSTRHGLLGNGDTGSGSESTPQRVDLSATTDGFEMVVTARTHSCAIAAPNGARGLYCWGENSWGQLGQGYDSISSGSPLSVDDTQEVSDVSVGYYHSCADNDGELLSCWGGNLSGATGQGVIDNERTLEPSWVVPLHTVQNEFIIESTTSFASSNCAVDVDGALYCWGRNDYYQLGLGPFELDDEVAYPKPVYWPHQR